MRNNEPADRLFMQWWQLRIVEQFSTHEMPSAWLFFTMSMHLQDKLDPL